MRGDDEPSDRHLESLVVSRGRPSRTSGAPINTPIVLTAPYEHAPEGNHYLRSQGSDTITAFERAVGALDGGDAVAFSSGMSAIAAIVEGQASGTVAVVPSTAYSGSLRIFEEQRRLGRMQLRYADITDTAGVAAALSGADLLWLETVTNPMMGVPDLAELIAAARSEGVISCVDATLSTPLLARPLELGADVVMHSATKSLAGHSDLVMGVLVTASTERAESLRSRRRMTGAIPGALESYLALRGLRTLAVRMQRAQENAMELAHRLDEHPRVTRVRYPGLLRDPGHKRASRLYDGFGAMLAFEIDGTVRDAERVCESVRLIHHATSLGGVESLIERRARHRADADAGTPPTLLRLSVGIEHIDDLWADLSSALESHS